MICPKCGAFVNENNSVCWNCHEKINSIGRSNNVIEYKEDYPFENRNVITTGDWIVTFILLAIPIINIIMPLVWAFSSSTPLSKKNFGKAILITWVVSFVFMILFWSTIIGTLNSLSIGTRI